MQENDQEFSFKKLFVPLTTLKAIHFIILIGLIVFANGLFNNFVGDDGSQIVDNIGIHSISNIPTFFSGSTYYNGGAVQSMAGEWYRPLLSTFFSLIYTSFGSNYFAFHFFQLIFCIANACILFLLLKHFFNKSVAFVLSLIFLVHPINSETTLYISDSQEVLFFFFGILSLWVVINYKSQKAFIIAALCLFMSILSKETGILFVFITLLYIFFFERKYLYKQLGYTILILISFSLLRLHATNVLIHSTNDAPIQNLGLAGRILNMPAIVFFYLKTFIFPLNLATSYQWVYTQVNLNNVYIPLGGICIFLILVITFALFLYRNYLRKYFVVFCFFSSWFFVGMLLHIQIFPLDQTVAERWFYFPIVGLLGMIGIFLQVIHINFRNKWILMIAIVIIILLSLRTIIRSSDWRDEFTLANHDIKVSKEAYNLENVLSASYLKEGDMKDAKIHAERSIDIYPTVTNLTTLGVIYLNMGDYKKAKESYLTALKYGDYYLTYENLGGLALLYGNAKENIDFMTKAVRMYPYNAKVWMYLAILEYKQNDKDEAKIAIEHAYYLDRSANIEFFYDKITNDQPFNLKFNTVP